MSMAWQAMQLLAVASARSAMAGPATDSERANVIRVRFMVGIFLWVGLQFF
ncbi:hypothetical protein D3C87_2157960 [compost metagenome]